MRSLSFIRPIGAGAFGTVYLAELVSGQNFRRSVAVKVLLRDRPDTEMFLTRFRDEARLLGLLHDDAILEVLDMVQIEGADAVVMEYIEGVDLESLQKDGRSPTPRALAEVGAIVAGALSRAHNARHPTSGQPLNVIHRDVKPANIMVTATGTVKLLDFGVARARFDARESFTGQMVLGTLNYMAPEYIVTGEVSPQVDVYGLGLTLWQIATGEPFGQPKVRQDSHERRVKARLDQLQATHPALVPVLWSMLQWNPGDRPDSAEAERRLQDVADNSGGPGLKSWARGAVAESLRGRGPVADSNKLAGRNIRILASVADSPETGQVSSSSAPSAFTRGRPSGPASLPPLPPDDEPLTRVTAMPLPAAAPRRPAPSAGPAAAPPLPAAPAPPQRAPLPQAPPYKAPLPQAPPPKALPPQAPPPHAPPPPAPTTSATPVVRTVAPIAATPAPILPPPPAPPKRPQQTSLLTTILQGALLGIGFGLVAIAAIVVIYLVAR